MNEPRWESLDHISDLELFIRGQSEEDLFANAALAVVAQIVELEDLQDVSEKTIEISSGTPEERFLDWLRELLYLVYTEDFLVSRIESLRLSEKNGEYKAVALVRGESIDPGRHRMLHEVKTVTYQEFLYGKEKDFWRARVVFDV